MHSQKRWLLVINILGGAAVLGSYAWGLSTHPGAAKVLWAGTPQVWQWISTANMLLAALGYFAFTIFILLRLDPEHTRLFGRFGYGAFNALYAAILFPSAAWMPLTFAAIAAPEALTVWSVRLLLAFIGLASLSLLLVLWSVDAQPRVRTHYLALIGCALFCLQTVVMDAIVWAAFFNP